MPRGRPRYKPEPGLIDPEAANAFFAANPNATPEQCQAFVQDQIAAYWERLEAEKPEGTP